MWKVSAGWAHLAIGSLDEARDLLEDVHDDELEPVQQADRLALMAEVEKSSGGRGSKARARQFLEQALSVLEGEPEAAVNVTRLRVEHDLARLTHFVDGDPTAAIPQYRKVSAAWQALPGHSLDEAITLRNLAEAEMAVADQGAPDDAPRCSIRPPTISPRHATSCRRTRAIRWPLNWNTSPGAWP